MPLTVNSFSPSTVIQSSAVNTNFTNIKNVIDALRPQMHVYIQNVLVAGNNVTVEVKIRTGQTLFLSAVDLRVKTAPTGADVIVDINKNGASLFTTRPRVVDGATTGGSGAVFTGSTPSVTDGDVITFDIDQIGSTEAGRDLSIGLSFFI